MNAFIRIYLPLLTIVAFAPCPARGQAQPPKTSGVPSQVAANATEAKPSPPEGFKFNGGSFRDYTRKLGQQFGTNFLDVLEVRGEEANRLQIPKMRHTLYATDWSLALKLYNQISEEGNGFLGKWIFTPERPFWITDGTGPSQPSPPETLIFMPPKPAAGEGGAIQVRAFPILRLTQQRQKELLLVIEQESQRIQEYILSGRFSGGQDSSLAEGRISVHENTGLLVAVGGRTYVELVKTVVDAFMANSNYPSPSQRQ